MYLYVVGLLKENQLVGKICLDIGKSFEVIRIVPVQAV